MTPSSPRTSGRRPLGLGAVLLASVVLAIGPTAPLNAQASFASTCTGLVAQFDELRRSVESDLDQSAAQHLSDLEYYGMSLQPETIEQGLAVVHEFERYMENKTREWLNVGPQRVNIPGRVTGRNLRKVMFGGERTWFGQARPRARKVEVVVNKTDGRARTRATVCRWPADGSGPQQVGVTKIFQNGNQTPRRTWVIDDLNMDYITVYLVNESAALSFEYNVRFNVLDQYDVAQAPPANDPPANSPSNVITTVGFYDVSVFPPDSDGSGTPLGTFTAEFWHNSASDGYSARLGHVPNVIPYVTQPAVEYTNSRIRTTGNSAVTFDVRAQGNNRWQGTMVGANGQQYRIRMVPRP